MTQIRSGDFRRGCEAADGLAREAPRFFAAYNLLGLCAAQQGDDALAEALFRKSIELNPKHPDSRNNLAVQLLKHGDLKAAEAEFTTVLSLSASDVTALYNLGKIELAEGHVAPAAGHLRRAAQLAPADSAIRLAYGRALAAAGDGEEARRIAGEVLDSDPNPAAVAAAAVLAAQAGDRDTARRGIGRALQLDPGAREFLLAAARTETARRQYESALAILDPLEPAAGDAPEWNALAGYASYKTGQAGRAIALLRHALEIDPKCEECWMQIGEALLYFHSMDAAADFFQAGTKELPASPRLHFGLAVAYLAADRNTDALLAHLDQALKLAPSFEPAVRIQCIVYNRQRNWPKLEETAARWLHLNTRSGEAYYYKAQVLLARQAASEAAPTSQAAALLEKAIALDPDFVESRVALSKLLIQEQRFDAAIRELERAARLKPDDSSVHYQLAMAYRHAGQETNSQRELEQVRRLKANRQEQEWKFIFRVAQGTGTTEPLR